MNSLMGIYKRHLLVSEFFISVVLALGIVVLLHQVVGQDVIAGALKSSRSGVYTALASAFGSLLGFVLTSASIVVTVSQLPQFQSIRQSRQYVGAYTVYAQAMLWLAIATVWAIAGLVTDTQDPGRLWYTYVMLWLVILSALRIYRCVWLLQVFVRFAATVQQR
jgi:hypothetical protein